MKRNVLKTILVPTLTKITAQSVFNNLRFLITSKIGIIVYPRGKNTVTSIVPMNIFLPGNSYLDSANPAIDVNKTVRIVAMIAMKTVLPK